MPQTTKALFKTTGDRLKTSVLYLNCNGKAWLDDRFNALCSFKLPQADSWADSTQWFNSQLLSSFVTLNTTVATKENKMVNKRSKSVK